MDRIQCFGLPAEPWTVNEDGFMDSPTVMSSDGGSIALVTTPRIERGDYVQTWKRDTLRIADAITALPDAARVLDETIRFLDRVAGELPNEAHDSTIFEDIDFHKGRMREVLDALRGKRHAKHLNKKTA